MQVSEELEEPPIHLYPESIIQLEQPSFEIKFPSSQSSFNLFPFPHNNLQTLGAPVQ